MHEITGDRNAVEKLLKDTVKHLESSTPGGARKKRVTTASARAKPAAKAESAAGVWGEALQRMQKGAGEKKAASAASLRRSPGAAPGRAIDTPYAPRDQMIALFQSAMDEYLNKTVPQAAAAKRGTGAKKAAAKRTRAAAAKPIAKTGAASLDPFYIEKPRPARGGAVAADLMAKLSPLDPGWVKVVVEKAKLLFKGKHRFIAHKSENDFRFQMSDKSTVAIVGDWGGGNEAAQAVARQIAKLKPNHVIHLGDVYYAGTPEEVQERFLKFWPTPQAPGMSLALNSNHEMYSGGYGYFDYTLKKFKQPASYFSLANAHWRFIGLDTGYDEHDLHAPQAEWLAKQVGQPGPKNILLSHHQLFSAYETTDTSKLRGKVQPMLGRVYGWIWGHEHLAVVYEKHDGINAICLGNGCFPYDFPKSKAAIPVKWLDNRQSSDPDYPGGHTFALLKIDGPRIDIDFIDENGKVGYTETWS